MDVFHSGPVYGNLHSIASDKLGRIYICGGFKDSLDIAPGDEQQFLVNNHNYDAVTVILDKKGTLIHGFSIGGLGSDQGRNIKVDSYLNYYISGTFANQVDVDPGPDSLIFIANNTSDIYFQKFDPFNNLLWALQLVTFRDEVIYMILP